MTQFNNYIRINAREWEKLLGSGHMSHSYVQQGCVLMTHSNPDPHGETLTGNHIKHLYLLENTIVVYHYTYSCILIFFVVAPQPFPTSFIQILFTYSA